MKNQTSIEYPPWLWPLACVVVNTAIVCVLLYQGSNRWAIGVFLAIAVCSMFAAVVTWLDTRAPEAGVSVEESLETIQKRMQKSFKDLSADRGA